ncbi:MAG TPA: DUF3054 domain-containing protein [Ktedonobacterales bacterium]
MSLTSTPLDPVTAQRAVSTAAQRWRVAALVAGDALSFLAFAAAGRQTHNEAAGLGALGQVAVTALPFALGWFLVSPWLGAFRRTLTIGVQAMVRRTELAWLAAWPVTLLLRWGLAGDHRVPLSFAIVILLSNAVFLGLWRGVFAWATRRVRW